MSRPAKARSLKAISKSTSTEVRRIPTTEEVAIRAYEIYRERGGGEGSPLDDWLQAERELAKPKR